MDDKHTIRDNKPTIRDYAIDRFSERVENEEAAKLKVTADSFDCISISGDDHGWYDWSIQTMTFCVQN